MARGAGALPAALALALALAGCGSAGTDATPHGGAAAPAAAPPGADPGGASRPVEPAEVADLAGDGAVARLVAEPVATLPHDPTAFTQGLEHHDGALLESTGLYGSSERRRVDPATGRVLASVPLPPGHFGEGLTVVGDRVVQLTWREGVAHVADAATLAPLEEVAYDGEGWGLCHDGRRLVASDGSAVLRFRDPSSLAVLGQVEVVLDGAPVTRLNELECADGLVWANVWQTSEIVAIDPATGEVLAVVDAAELVPHGLDDPDAVLNGIARRPGAGTFWLTGKRWPVLYEVRLVLAG